MPVSVHAEAGGAEGAAAEDRPRGDGGGGLAESCEGESGTDQGERRAELAASRNGGEGRAASGAGEAVDKERVEEKAQTPQLQYRQPLPLDAAHRQLGIGRQHSSPVPTPPRRGGGRVFGSAAAVTLPMRSPSSSSFRNLSTERQVAAPSTARRPSLADAQPPPPLPGTALFEDSPLPCPICNVTCLSLLDLNVHLDETHSQAARPVANPKSQQHARDAFDEFEEDPAAAVLSWFRSAKEMVVPTISRAGSRINSLPQLAAAARGVADLNDPGEEGVTRTHWQKDAQGIGVETMCSVHGCGKVLGIITGKVNCRKCGRLYCDAHCQMQMRLAKDASHDPVNGVWCRVCESCYTRRDTYLEEKKHQGACRDRTEVIARIRRKTLDKNLLESNRLGKRLEKLAQLHHTAAASASVSGFSSSSKRWSGPVRRSSAGLSSSFASPLSSPTVSGGTYLGFAGGIRAAEQHVVKWEEDNAISHCPFCFSAFGTITNRKHHCRLCGRVICGQATCSSPVLLFRDIAEDADQHAVGSVRACRACKSYVSRRRELVARRGPPPKIVTLYQDLTRYQRMIDAELPRFSELVAGMVEEPSKRNSLRPEQIQNITQLRVQVLGYVAHYEETAKRIKALSEAPGAARPQGVNQSQGAHHEDRQSSASERRLQDAIFHAASIYLETVMVPLQLLPRLLNAREAAATGALAGPATGGGSRGEVLPRAAALPTYLPDTAAADELRAQLAVLREQRVLVEGFVQDARARRKLDDVRTLKASLDELEGEIARIQQELGGG